jgi:hypothetical protein
MCCQAHRACPSCAIRPGRGAERGVVLRFQSLLENRVEFADHFWGQQQPPAQAGGRRRWIPTRSATPVDSIGSSTKSRVSHSERRPSARFPGDEDGSARKIASQTRFRPASSPAGPRDGPSARAESFMEWPAPPSGVVRSPAVQTEESVWILLSLASTLARTSAASSGWMRPARSLCGVRQDGRR